MDKYGFPLPLSPAEYAVELDGTDAKFVITNVEEDSAAGALPEPTFDSALWRGGNQFTIEVYVKPYSVTGKQPLVYQPSMGVGDALGSTGSDGVYVGIDNGEVFFFVMGSQVLSQITRTVAGVAGTIKANEWQLISATYDTVSTPRSATL